jgi:hypothetical protein
LDGFIMKPISNLTITCNHFLRRGTGSRPLLEEEPCPGAVCHTKAIQNDALWKLFVDAGKNLFGGVKGKQVV